MSLIFAFFLSPFISRCHFAYPHADNIAIITAMLITLLLMRALIFHAAISALPYAAHGAVIAADLMLRCLIMLMLMPYATALMPRAAAMPCHADADAERAMLMRMPIIFRHAAIDTLMLSPPPPAFSRIFADADVDATLVFLHYDDDATPPLH